MDRRAIQFRSSSTAEESRQKFRRWFHRLYSQPDITAKTRGLSYLKYQFAMSSPANASEARTALVAEEYHQGHLDC